MLRPVDDLVLPAVRDTIVGLDKEITPADAGAVRLAQRYAAAMDDAARVAAELDAIDPLDEDDAARIARLAAKVTVQAVLETLGPKLLAVLEQLGATPKARALRKGGAGSAKPGGKLGQLRGTRAG